MIFILTNSVLLLLHSSHVTVVENRRVELWQCSKLKCLYPLLNEVTQNKVHAPGRKYQVLSKLGILKLSNKKTSR